MDVPGPIEKFGRYHLLHRIAVGGMAEIFLAYVSSDGNQGQLLVIKRIREDLSRDREFVNMFLDEGRVIQSLAHPNIVRMMDCGVIEDRSYIGLEFVWGESLSNLMVLAEHQQIQFPAGAALYIGGEVARALHYAHHYRGPGGAPAPVIHRDVTLGNVIVSYDGMVKVLDFGIAKTQDRLVQTQIGSVKGTLIYLAPEQILEQEIGPYTDIYQLGVLLYKTLVGREPIVGETEAAVVSGIVRGRVIKPGAVIPGFPASVEALLLKAMARKPEQRFATAGELRGAILELLGEHYAVGKQGLVNLVARITGDRQQRQQAYVGDLIQGVRAQGEQSDLLRWAAGTKEPKTFNVELSVVEEVDLSSIRAEEPEADPTLVNVSVQDGSMRERVAAAAAGFRREPTVTGTQNRAGPLPRLISLQERYADGVLSPELTETGMVITGPGELEQDADQDDSGDDDDDGAEELAENEFTASGVFSSVRTLVSAPPTRVTAAALAEGPTQVSQMLFPDARTLLAAEPEHTLQHAAASDEPGASSAEELLAEEETAAGTELPDELEDDALIEEERDARTIIDPRPRRQETGEIPRAGGRHAQIPNEQPTLVMARVDPSASSSPRARPRRFGSEGPTRVDGEDDPFDDMTVQERGLMGAQTVVPTVTTPAQRGAEPEQDLDFDIDIDFPD